MINDDIIEKIDTLVDELNQMKIDYQKRLSAKEKEIEELVSQLKERESNLGDLEKRATEISNSIEEKQAKVDELDKKVSELDKEVSKNEAIAYNIKDLWDELEFDIKKQRVHSDNVDEFFANFDNLKDEHKEFEKDLSKLKTDIEGLLADYEVLTKKQDSIQTSQNSISKDVLKSETSVQSCFDRIAEIQTKIDTINAYVIKSLNAELKIEEFLQQQAVIGTDLQKTKEYIDEANPVVEKIDERIKSFIETEKTLNYCKVEFEQLKSQFASLKKRLDESVSIENKITEFNTKQSQNQTTLQSLTTAINGLKTMVATLERTVSDAKRLQDGIVAQWNIMKRDFDSWIGNEANLQNFIINTVISRVAAKGFWGNNGLVRI
ncbi:MAG: hypothetical protein J6A28_03710 [Clostridia bacterium]|nr:hypothetical protein [Clostridia bacterium]